MKTPSKKVLLLVGLFVIALFIALAMRQFELLRKNIHVLPVVTSREADTQNTYASEEWKKGTVVELSEYFSKDEKAVYWLNQYRILGADPVTFHVTESRYALDRDHIYFSGYAKDSSRLVLYVLDGADPDSFFAFPNYYAKDRWHVYYDEEVVDGADPRTIQPIGDTYDAYAKDVYFAYNRGQRIPNVDAWTFRIVPKSEMGSIYTEDKKRVMLRTFFHTDDGKSKYETRDIVGADPSTFQVLGGIYAKDERHVYFGTRIIDGADVATFRVYRDNVRERVSEYTLDSHSVYFEGKPIDGADPVTLQYTIDPRILITGSFVVDKNNAYRDGKVFPREDLAQLEKGQIPSNARSLGSNYYRYQGEIYYYDSGPHAVPSLDALGADAASFHVLKYGYAADKNSVYCDGQYMKGKTRDSLDFNIIGKRESWNYCDE